MPSSTSRRTVIKTGAVLMALGLTACTGTPSPSPSSTSPSTPAAGVGTHRNVHLRHRGPAPGTGPGALQRRRKLPDHPPDPRRPGGSGPDHRQTHAAARHGMDRIQRGPHLHLQAPQRRHLPGRHAVQRRRRLRTTSTAGSPSPRNCGSRRRESRSRASSRPTPTTPRCPSSRAAPPLSPDTVRIDLTQPLHRLPPGPDAAGLRHRLPRSPGRGHRRRPEPDAARQPCLRLRHQPGGNRTLQPGRLGRNQRQPGQQQGLLG